MQQRRHLKQLAPLGQRLNQRADRLREEARGTPPGVERYRLIRLARQAESAAYIDQCLASPRPGVPK
jgi:hypothetical protein